MARSELLSVQLSNGEQFDYFYGQERFGALLERGLSIVSGTLGSDPVHPETEGIAMYVRLLSQGGKEQFTIITIEKRGDRSVEKIWRASGQPMSGKRIATPDDFWDFALPVIHSDV
jgi:hypothetical protein